MLNYLQTHTWDASTILITSVNQLYTYEVDGSAVEKCQNQQS